MDFWSESIFGVQAPLTDQAVHDAEAALGVRLPTALLELLRQQNGGRVIDARSAFPTNGTSWASQHVPFEDLMGIGHAEGATSLLDTPYLVEEWGCPRQWCCSPAMATGGSRSTTGRAGQRVSPRWLGSTPTSGQS
jgi:SMI1 / KNR4 family (SUKH-1)